MVQARLDDRMLEDDSYYAVLYDRPPTPALDEAAVITTLRVTLTGWLDGQPVFVRTNLASPKDVSRDPVRTADDVLGRLLRSRRLYGLLPLLGRRPLTLVVRAWMPAAEEFRCWIVAGQLRAISQYEDSDRVRHGLGATTVYALTCADYRDLVRSVTAVIAASGLRTAMLDVARGAAGWWVVEINPFSARTDGCLFADPGWDPAQPGPLMVRVWHDAQTLGGWQVAGGIWQPLAPGPIPPGPGAAALRAR